MRSFVQRFFCWTVFAVCSAAQAGPLDIYWVDVEGGGATLIVTPAGESILIDAGESVDRDPARIHEVATRAAGLKKIDHLITTHWHSDHFGGVYGLSKLMPLERFYANRSMPDTLTDQQYAPFPVLRANYRKAAPSGPVILRPGDTLPLKQSQGGPAIALECLAANQNVIDAAKAHGAPNPLCERAERAALDTSENLNSLVVRLSYGKFTFFDSGDLTRNMETKLVCPSNLVGPITIYQAAHHGLDQSNHPVLIDSIRPRVAVVNNAAGKGAEPQTMKTLRSEHSIETVWQLHKNLQPNAGWNTADEYIANLSDKGDQARFIKASVQPDGTFSLQIGEKGARRVYQAR